MAKQQTQTKILQNVRIPLVGSAQNRATDPNKDQRFVNFFPESNKTPITQSNKMYLIKRAGLELSTSPSTAAVGRGIYYYAGILYSVFGNKVYKDTTELYTLATSTGSVGWAEATGATKYLFLCDGTNAYTITSAGVITQVNNTYAARANSTAYVIGDRRIPATDNGLFYEVTVAGTSSSSPPTWPTTLDTTVTDGTVTWKCAGSYGGFPTPHVPTPIFLDGYIFLAKKDTADIYNSDLEYPLGWSPSNYITAEMFPDNVYAMARQNNNIVAFGATSTEFFYDAGASGGTPLARNAAAVQQFGTCSPFGLFQNEKFCMVIAQSSSGGRCVWQIDGTTPKRVSTEYIEKLIDAEGTSTFTDTAFGIRTQGHFFYVINLQGQGRTLVYDVEEKMWHEWQHNGGVFCCNYATDKEQGFAYLQHATNGSIYTLKTTAYSDFGTAITCTATTAKLDFDTMKRKAISEIYIVGDTAPVSTLLSFRWSDDDYQTWSNTHTVDLGARSFHPRCGMFRRRAYQFVYTDNYPCRLEALEIEYRTGTH